MSLTSQINTESSISHDGIIESIASMGCDSLNTSKIKGDTTEDGEKIEVLHLFKGFSHRPGRVGTINLLIESPKRPVISDLHTALKISGISVNEDCRIYWQNKINHILPVFNHITLSLFLLMASKFNRRLFIVRNMTMGQQESNSTLYSMYKVDKTDEKIVLDAIAQRSPIYDKTEEAANESLLLIGRYDHMPIERARKVVKDKATASSKRDKTPKANKEGKIPKKK